MLFLILSVQDIQKDASIPMIAPRGLHDDIETALTVARNAQHSRYSSLVRQVFIFKLPLGGGWDPGDFREDSPYIMYSATRDPATNAWKEEPRQLLAPV